MVPPTVDRPTAMAPRVAVFRPAVDNASLVALLDEHHITSESVPLIQPVWPADHGAALRSELQRIDRYRWLAVTSAAGARFVGAAAQQVHMVRPPSLQVAAVGAATAAALAAVGLTADLVPQQATAAQLAAAFPPPPPPANNRANNTVLAPLAELASDDLVDGLTARGWAVTRINAYRLDYPTPSPDDRRRVMACSHGFYTSPSVVDAAVSALGLAHLPPTSICIGPKTAARAKHHKLDQVVVAQNHSNEGMVEALISLLGR